MAPAEVVLRFWGILFWAFAFSIAIHSWCLELEIDKLIDRPQENKNEEDSDGVLGEYQWGLDSRPFLKPRMNELVCSPGRDENEDQ
jgi:hypothetical protein